MPITPAINSDSLWVNELILLNNCSRYFNLIKWFNVTEIFVGLMHELVAFVSRSTTIDK